ncbi:hypothetical protein DKZ29_07905 [Limosilactobacillus reuteri]|uniref:Uncharacterized protein n=1 Tax=Limosilactobacillus reuteri TaxID=1598 RepID=A0ABD6Y6F4_LIMRT|nr:hypothetical protein [Limosilactobacillus reuteri]PWT34582.1 hypothetical protein DKZ24_08140 [Limosilactobacillus reuteri]PWT37480.1 hypothetical protein DKZ35_05085 [Limosilactobacillus reuteri]PWT57652.1 hypothetical protein DKZ29_07905 [Limosilactobacillus reuteri]PWT58450.1 hypothetical protein DKZ30_08050 [Limosilactobacillus reuteri]PWT65338.1 hypothetical protein DKZ28_08150 [Limosilactobacillus reuteri]
MTQPILNTVSTYDAKNERRLTYTYLGPERTTTSQLSIRENKSGSQPVFEKEQHSLDKEFILPANTLTNGTSYLAKLRVKLDNGYSEWSPEIKFMCLTTPRIIFDTIDQKQFIYTNDVLMSAIYTQKENDQVTSYRFTLYDQRHVTIQQFSMNIPTTVSPTRFSQRVRDIKKGKLYYIGLYVETEHGIRYEQLQEFTAQYISPSVSGVIQPQLNEQEGQINIELFLKQLLGTSAKAYIPNRDTDSDDHYSYWKDDYVIVPKDNPLMFTKLAMAKASNWVAKLWVMNVRDGLFLDFAQKNGKGQHIKFYKHNDYITAEKTFGHVVSRTRSNVVSGLGLKPFYLYIKVLEYRVEMLIEPDYTFKGDDNGDDSLSAAEKKESIAINTQTQNEINEANNKIIAARNRLQVSHDERWGQYIAQINAAIADARAHILNHDELEVRIQEIDDKYWDYFNKEERVNFQKEIEKARRAAEGALMQDRFDYLQRIQEIIAKIDSKEYTLEKGVQQINQYGDAYRFILEDIPVFDQMNLTLIKETYRKYATQYEEEIKSAGRGALFE